MLGIDCSYVLSPWTAEHVGTTASASASESVALDDAPLLFFERSPDFLTSSFALGAEMLVFFLVPAALEVSPFASAVEVFVFCASSPASFAFSFISEVEPSVFCALSFDLRAVFFAVEDEPLVFCVCSAALVTSFFALHGRHSLISSSTILGFQGAAFMMTRSTCLRQNLKGHTRVSRALNFLTIFLLLLMQ